MKKHWKTYLIAILIPLVVGGLSALLTRESMEIYKDIVSPPLAPPGWMFPVVWTLLYILMGISSARVYLSNGDKKAPATAEGLPIRKITNTESIQAVEFEDGHYVIIFHTAGEHTLSNGEKISSTEAAIIIK